MIQQDISSSPNANRRYIYPAADMTLIRLKIVSPKEEELNGETTYQAADLHVSEANPLETIVKQLKQYTGKDEAAQPTVDQVKVEGIDTNFPVLKFQDVQFEAFCDNYLHRIEIS